MHGLTRAVLFSSTHLSTRMELYLVHARSHKIYPRVFFEQINLRVLTELNVSQITRILCARITTHDFPSSSNRAVPYIPWECEYQSQTLMSHSFNFHIGMLHCSISV